MNKKLHKLLYSGPYLFWSAAFIIIPLCMVFFYGLTDKTGAFTLANVMAIASAEHSKALWLSIGLSLISTLICFLLALLRDDAHRQDWDDDHKDETAEAENIFKVAHGCLKIIHHGADPNKSQQKCAENIGGQRMEIRPQFMLQYRSHLLIPSLSPSLAVWARPSDGCFFLSFSVSSINTSSRFAFFSDISSSAFCGARRPPVRSSAAALRRSGHP